MTGRVLIPPAVWRYFRDASAGWSTLREIGNFWQEEGFAPSGEPNDEQGGRRGHWREYEDSVDWTDPAQMARVLRVYEVLLASIDDDGLERCRQVLERNGFTLNETGRILLTSGHAATLPASLSAIRDPSLILDSFDRITRALPDDPAQAIGSAKELVEATAKTVLTELGESFDDKTAKLPQLIDSAQRALHLHPSMAAVGPDGSNAIKRILGGGLPASRWASPNSATRATARVMPQRHREWVCTRGTQTSRSVLPRRGATWSWIPLPTLPRPGSGRPLPGRGRDRRRLRQPRVRSSPGTRVRWIDRSGSGRDVALEAAQVPEP